MKYFTIAFNNDKNNIFEISEYAKRSNDAIRNAIKVLPLFKKNNNFILRYINERDLKCLCDIETLQKKELNRDSLINEGKFILIEIKDHITNVFYWLRTYLMSVNDL